MISNIWSHRSNSVGQDSYYDKVYSLLDYEAIASRIDRISERIEIDLKDGYSMCYINSVSSDGIELYKYRPANDISNYERIYISREELALEGILYMLDELKDTTMRTAFYNELDGKITFLSPNIRKTANKMDICIGGSESKYKVMYQADQLKYQIESVEHNQNFGVFYGTVRYIGRSGRYRKLVMAYGHDAVRGSKRRQYKDIASFLRKINEESPVNMLEAHITAEGAMVLVEVESEVRDFFEKHEDSSASPCYMLTVSDCSAVPNKVTPGMYAADGAFAALPISDKQVDKDLEVRYNEDFTRPFGLARDQLNGWIRDFDKRMDYYVYNDTNCINIFDIKKAKQMDGIPKVVSVMNNSLSELCDIMINPRMLPEDTIRAIFTRLTYENFIFSSAVNKQYEQTKLLGMIYFGT